MNEANGSAALAKREVMPEVVAVVDGPRRFSAEQRDLILQTCCGGASETEAAVLVAIAEARGLNPLTGECYFVKRYDRERGWVWAVQASIDSFRIKAEETGDYAGQDAPVFEYDKDGRPTVARVAVYRKSVPGRPFATGEARWKEYVQTTKEGQPTRFWQKMPHNQLAKCAEALALRKAFPKVLAKIYTPEEMAQADNGREEPAAAPKETPSSPALPKGDEKRMRGFMAEFRKCKTNEDVAIVSAKVVKAREEGVITPEQRDKIGKVYQEVVGKIAAAAVPVDDDGGAAEAEADVVHGQFDE